MKLNLRWIRQALARLWAPWAHCTVWTTVCPFLAVPLKWSCSFLELAFQLLAKIFTAIQDSCPVLWAQCCCTVGLLLPTTTMPLSDLFSSWPWVHLLGQPVLSCFPLPLQHTDSAQCSDLSGREDRYKWLRSAGKSSTEELLTLQVYIPCKALFVASFSFVPAQCSSVKPWSRWSLLRRLFSRQKSLVWAWAGSWLRCNGYRGSLKIMPAAFPWSTLCFEDALVLLGWNQIMTWKSTFNSISSVQTLS